MSAPNPFAPQSQPGAGQPLASQPTTQFTNGVASDQGAGVIGALAQEQEPPIDLNDPMLTSESLTVQEGDAFADPPPPPAGRYRLKVKFAGIQNPQDKSLVSGKIDGVQRIPDGCEAYRQKDKNGAVVALYVRTVAEFLIIDPNGKFDGIHTGVPYKFMDTKEQRQNPSKIMDFLTKVKRPDGKPWAMANEKLSHVVLADRFVKALAGEPEIEASLDWEWSCQGCAEIGKKTGDYSRSAKNVTGMNRFPQIRPGVFSPEMMCPSDKAHGFSKARPVIQQFFMVK